jgi:hypothetical protein
MTKILTIKEIEDRLRNMSIVMRLTNRVQPVASVETSEIRRAGPAQTSETRRAGPAQTSEVKKGRPNSNFYLWSWAG